MEICDELGTRINRDLSDPVSIEIIVGIMIVDEVDG
jgi:hypothetical protein